MHFKRYGCVADCFLLAVICVGLVLPLACCERSHGGEKEEAEAAAALALAKAKRERLQGVGKQLEVSTECHTDLVTATRECDRTGKRLVIWVSCEPRKHLEFYRPLIDQVHACIKSHNKSDEPRVVIQGGDGIERYFPERKLTVEKAGDVRAYWKLVNDRPANAPPAKVIEEVKRKATPGLQLKVATYYTQDAAGGWLAWNGSAWAKSQTGPPAGYGIVGYLRSPQQEAAPALTAGANFQYAPPVAACTSNG